MRFYLADHLGSVRGLADASGAITDSYSYDPYGQRSVVTGATADTPFGYAGQYTDAETGFQYLRARYYDPATGQFLTVDPLVGSTGHPYAYAADNPANYTDPSGLFWGLCDTGPSKCLQAGLAALNSTSWGHNILVTINNFDNTDFSNAVYGDVTGLLGSAQAIYDGAAYCVQDPAGCKHSAEALVFYIQQHPSDVIMVLARSGLQPLLQVIQDICSGHYGAAAGHLLVDFVLLKGAGVIKDLLHGADIAVAGQEGKSAANGIRLAEKLRAEERASGVHHMNQPADAAAAIKDLFALTKDPVALRAFLLSTSPDEVLAWIKRAPGWQRFGLKEGTTGAQIGGGWVLREPGRQGFIEYHPGGGSHGPSPYYRFGSGPTGTVRVPIDPANFDPTGNSRPRP